MVTTQARGTTVRRGLALAGLLACGCGDAASPAVEAAPGAVAEASSDVEGPGGDPLLRRAREGIRAGELPAAERAEVLGSTAPEHARARRVLLAMAEPPAGVGNGSDPDDGAPQASDDASSRPPPILPPGDPAALPEPIEPARGDRAEQAGRAGNGPATPSSERPVRPKARADLGGLSLKATPRGATLTIAAPSSLVVGVANQPTSGIVRLVIESAQAGAAVLHARPSTEGAAVTGVRQGQGTVQITIRLEPGWSLGSVQPFSGGAKVHLVAPT